MFGGGKRRYKELEKAPVPLRWFRVKCRTVNVDSCLICVSEVATDAFDDDAAC